MSSLGTHLLHKRLNITDHIMVKRGGVYRWSDEKLNSGLGRRPKG
jgi:hypothetical protein